MPRFWCPREDRYYEEPEGTEKCPNPRCSGPLIKVEKGKAHGVHGRPSRF